MKKFLTLILFISLVPMCFAGCNSNLGEQYWADTSISLQECFSGEDYLAVKNIDFNDNLDYIMNCEYGSSYAELNTIYSALFKASISYADTYYVLFQNNPVTENSKFKNSIVEINNNVETFNNDLKEFLNQKSEYESFITFTDDATANSNLELIRLLKFKRNYLDLINSALKLSDSMLSAYKHGYYDFVLSEESSSEAQRVANCRLAIYTTNYDLINLCVDVLEIYNNKDNFTNYKRYWNGLTSYYTTIIEMYENDKLVAAQDIDTQLTYWKNCYDMFNLDKEKFLEIVEDINFEKLSKYGHDAEAYAEATENPEDKNKVKFFLNFYSKVDLLISYTQNLFQK